VSPVLLDEQPQANTEPCTVPKDIRDFEHLASSTTAFDARRPMPSRDSLPRAQVLRGPADRLAACSLRGGAAWVAASPACVAGGPTAGRDAVYSVGASHASLTQMQ
jgi:hypothetical protein